MHMDNTMVVNIHHIEKNIHHMEKNSIPLPKCGIHSAYVRTFLLRIFKCEQFDFDRYLK